MEWSSSRGASWTFLHEDRQRGGEGNGDVRQRQLGEPTRLPDSATQRTRYDTPFKGFTLRLYNCCHTNSSGLCARSKCEHCCGRMSKTSQWQRQTQHRVKKTAFMAEYLRQVTLKSLSLSIPREGKITNTVQPSRRLPPFVPPTGTNALGHLSKQG